MRVGSGVLIAVVGWGWLLAAPPTASARRCKDTAACRDCYDRTLSVVEDCADADTLISNRQSRTQLANVEYCVCAAQVPGRPGSCTLTIRELNKCGRKRRLSINRSWTTFKKNARRSCGRKAARAAEQARRQCLRDRACSCSAPTTTSTTTSTTTTTTFTTTTTTTSTTVTSSTTTTTTTGTGTTASTTSTTTSTTASTTSTTSGGGGGGGSCGLPAAPDGSACQQACIQDVTASCQSDCISSCRGAQGALPKCFRACRNGQCATLRAQCVPTDNTDFEGNNPGGLSSTYFSCCKVSGDCDGDGEDTLACETTTTVTTTSSTTSTTTASTTTTSTITLPVVTTTTLFPR